MRKESHILDQAKLLQAVQVVDRVHEQAVTAAQHRDHVTKMEILRPRAKLIPGVLGRVKE